MQETTPRVHLIAGTRIVPTAISLYLDSIGADWHPTASRDAELLTEFAGRMCYKSWQLGLNPNVTRVRAESGEYLQNVLRAGHGSVLEHASFTFLFQDVSRVFTHELVRHRAGVAISQESLRYVRLTELGFRIPDALSSMRERILTMVETLEDFQQEITETLMPNPDEMPFALKKEITSAMRRLAPLGLSTSILWTANVRTLRHVIEQRTAQGAEEEIRGVFDAVADILQAEAPLLMADYSRSRSGEWTTLNGKV